MAEVRDAIEAVKARHPDVVDALLYEIFEDSKCFQLGGPPCGHCQACRFVSAVDRQLTRDTDPNIGSLSSIPVDHSDTQPVSHE